MSEESIRDNKHFNYATFTELVSVINSFLMDKEIVDNVHIEIGVPHESFRLIDKGLRYDLGDLDKEQAEKSFTVTYDERLDVFVYNQTEREIEEATKNAQSIQSQNIEKING